MKDEVTYVLYICSAIRPFRLVKKKKNHSASSSRAKVLTVPLHTLGHNFNIFELALDE